MSSVLRTPMAHQTDALNYCGNRGRIALFMEMRLGKTLVAIRWAKQESRGRILIVAPLSVLPSWYEELENELIAKKTIHWLIGPKSKRHLPAQEHTGGWFLVNYECLRVSPELQSIPWSTIILDESTKVRNPQAQITKVVQKRFYHVPRKAVLSGLPAPESPLDYFEQFRFLNKQFMSFDNFWKFRNYFFQTDYTGWDWRPRVGATTKIKEAVHAGAFVLTRKQVNVGSKKIYEKRYVEMTNDQKKLYEQVEETFEYKRNDFEKATKWATVKFTWLARLAGGFDPTGEVCVSPTKCAELLNLLQGELKNEKVVVWFRFNSELFYVAESLERAGIQHVYITGETPMEGRQAAAEHFRISSGCRVMLAQVKCGKYGLNWSAASTAIYYSNSYDMEDRAQSEDRILHPSKTEPLLYIDLITKGTIDESVVEVLRQKYANSRIFMTKLVKAWLEKV